MSEVPFARPVLSAPQQVAASLKESILAGSLAPGDLLPSEVQLAQAFGVSRPTVREALRVLKASGLLAAERGRKGGHRVVSVSPGALGPSVGEFISISLGMQTLTYAELFEVRRSLEVLSAGTAAERRSAEALRALETAQPDLTALGEDAERVLAADASYHRALAECTANPLLVAFTTATAIAFRRASDDVGHVSPALVVAHLDEVTAAVRDRDAEGAREAMGRHLAYFAAHFDVAQG